jgi:hypothetical protein
VEDRLVEQTPLLLGTEELRWGLEIIKLTGRPSGSVFPLLDRLERPVGSRRCGTTARAAAVDVLADAGAMRVALLLVRFAAAVVGDDRYREQWEADVVGVRELGMSPLGVAFGAVRAVVASASEGAVMLFA